MTIYDGCERPKAKTASLPEGTDLQNRIRSTCKFIQATGFIPDVTSPSLVVQFVTYSRVQWQHGSRFSPLSYFCWMLCAADITFRIQGLIWRHHRHHISVRSCLPWSYTDPKSFAPSLTCCQSLSTGCVFSFSLPSRTPGVWQRESFPSACSLPCQSPLVFLCCSLYVHGIYIVRLTISFCACGPSVFSSVRPLRYLNGIKQMWWVECRLNGHWSGCVISPSTLHAVCYSGSKWLAFCPLDCAAALLVERWIAWIWAPSHNQYDRCVLVPFSVALVL